MTMKSFFTMSEAARVCSVDRSTMHRWVTANKIKAFCTPGGHKRILSEDLKQWLDEHQYPYDANLFLNNKAKILIVDDDESIRILLESILKGIFVELDFAEDGFEAGKKLIQFKPDLIILDLFMPQMNGFDVCKKVKSDPETKHTKILILSGHGTPENKEKAFSLGADGFMDKPCTNKEVLENVEQLLIQKK